MSCGEIFPLLSASLDGELTSQEETELQAHLEQCPSCRALLAELAAIHDACGDLEVTPPPELKQMILDHLPPQSPSQRPATVYWKRWGAMAAALVVISLAAWRLPRTLYAPPTNGIIEPQAAESQSSTPMSAPEQEGSSKPVIVSERALEYSADEAEVLDAPAPEPFLDQAVPEDGEVTAPQTTFRGEAVATGLGDAGNSEVKDEYSYGSQNSGALDDSISMKAALATAPEPEPSASPSDMPRVALFRSSPVTGDLNAVTGGYDETPEEPAVSDGSEMYLSTARLEDVNEVPEAPCYCGVITLPEGTPVGDWPQVALSDQRTGYLLPANQFWALLVELRQSDAGYSIRLSGDDVSPESPEGLLIITSPAS